MDEPNAHQVFYDLSDTDDFRDQFADNSFEAFETDLDSGAFDGVSPTPNSPQGIADGKHLVSHTTSDSFGRADTKHKRVKAHQLRVASLRAELHSLQTRILLQRSVALANSARVGQAAATGTLFVSSFADLSVKIDEFRHSYNLRTDMLKADSVRRDEEIRLKEDRLAELDKRLLTVSIHFSTIKKDIQRKSRKGLLSRLFW